MDNENLADWEKELLLTGEEFGESTTEIPDTGDGTGMFDPQKNRIPMLTDEQKRKQEEEAERVQQSKAVAYDWLIESLTYWADTYSEDIPAVQLLDAVQGVQLHVLSSLAYKPPQPEPSPTVGSSKRTNSTLGRMADEVTRMIRETRVRKDTDT